MQKQKNSPKKRVLVELKYVPPLPSAVELERDVLGCMLIDNTVVGALCDYFKNDSFFDNRNQQIFDVIVELFKRGRGIDEMILHKELEALGLSDMIPYHYITTLTNIASVNLYGQYAQIIEDKAVKRRAIRTTLNTLNNLFSDADDALEIVRQTVEELDKSHQGFSDYKDITPETHSKELFEQIYHNMMSDSFVSGIPTGVKDLDMMFGGWQTTHLACIGARTRHGKTAIAIGFAFNASSVPVDPQHPIESPHFESKHPVGIISMEMKATEIWVRLLTMELHRMGFHFRYAELIKGNLFPEDMAIIQQALGRLTRRGIYVDDTPAMDVMRIKSKAMMMKDRYKVRLVFIDYIQLIPSLQWDKNYGSNVAINTGQDMKSLKTFAKQLDMAFVALSQMDRASEKTGTPRMPNIAELKNSGGIEESCDEIMLLFRPEVYYNGVVDENGEDLRGVMQINFAKNKQGATGICNVPFDVTMNTFPDVEYGSLEYNKYLSKEGRVNPLLDQIDRDNNSHYVSIEDAPF